MLSELQWLLVYKSILSRYMYAWIHQIHRSYHLDKVLFFPAKLIFFFSFLYKNNVVSTHYKCLSMALLMYSLEVPQYALLISVYNVCFWGKIRTILCLFVLRFYSPVNPMGSCRARSVYVDSPVIAGAITSKTAQSSSLCLHFQRDATSVEILCKWYCFVIPISKWAALMEIICSLQRSFEKVPLIILRMYKISPEPLLCIHTLWSSQWFCG